MPRVLNVVPRVLNVISRVREVAEASIIISRELLLICILHIMLDWRKIVVIL